MQFFNFIEEEVYDKTDNNDKAYSAEDRTYKIYKRNVVIPKIKAFQALQNDWLFELHLVNSNSE